jgi:hypothetical protein
MLLSSGQNLQLIYRYFLPAAATLALNTGLRIGMSTLQNGLMMLLIQLSYTSLKKFFILSSLAGIVDELPLPYPLI